MSNRVRFSPSLAASGLDNRVSTEIEQLCDSFESAWRRGETPRIEDFVSGSAVGERSALLKELLHIEVFHRRRRGEMPRRADYLARFDGHRDLVEEALDEYCDAEETAVEVATHPSGASRLVIRCPGCHAPTEVALDSALTDLTCGSCGSQFSLVDDKAASQEVPPLAKLGRFELVARVGMGAFGSVWKARDKELDRTVAIKVPRQGGMTLEEQEKFFREARAAAQLRHPYIVSVHEVGREGDAIYIVSDFVRGVTLADWLTGGQPTTGPEAAELCAKIADALHHAHEKGVIHRDLKPANIMIDGDGQPHLMDFGLARREAGEVTVTLDGHVLGTPAYMSPEQAQGESHAADRRSDIYSLGVILFQLLTGERPFRGNARMIMHQVIHDEPPGLRQLNPNVHRDLETIALKCLEKAPGRRYQTAATLAEELRRFLRGEPVQARPISRPERALRWVRRNKTVSALSASVVLALVSGTVFSTYFALHAGRQANLALARESDALAAKRASDAARRDAHAQQKQAEQARAEEIQARQQAEAVSNFLVQAFQTPDPSRDGRTITVAEVLDRAEAITEQELSGQLLVQASLLAAIGHSRRGLGLVPEALAPLARVVALREEALGPDHPDTLRAMYNLASAYVAAGRFDEAIPLHEHALAALRDSLGPDHPDTLELMSGLAIAYHNLRRLDEAIPLYEQTLSARREKLEPNHPHTFNSMNNLANVYRDAGRLDESIALFEETLALRRENLGEDHPDTLVTMNNLGNAYASARRIDEAVSLFAQTLAARRARLGPDHPRTINAMNNLANAFRETGRLEEAIPLHEETCAALRQRLGDDHPDVLLTMNNLANAYHEAGRLDEATPLHEQTLAALRRKLGSGHPHTLNSMNNLANAYRDAGQFESAIPLYEDVLAAEPNDVRALDGRARVLATASIDSLRDGPRAMELANKACELTQYQHPQMLFTLASACAETGDFQSAIQWSERALELLGDGGNLGIREQLLGALASYQAGKPFRHPAAEPTADSR